MEEIDFDKTTPDFVDGDFKWYVDKHFQTYIESEQAINLPKLKGLGCFVVRNGSDVEDYVLINNKQQVISAYKYGLDGLEQMTFKINTFKIKKHYDDYEKANI